MLSPREFESLKIAFEDRRYRWSGYEADAEVNAGLSTLRGMRNPAAERLVRAIESWPREKQRLLLEAYRRRQQPDIVRRVGHPLTVSDERLIEEADAAKNRGLFGSARANRAPVHQVRRAVATALRPLLEEALGPPIDTVHGCWRFQTLIRGWRLRTKVDWGGRLHVVSYRQSLSGGNLVEGINVGLGVVTWPACIGLPSLEGWSEVGLDAAQDVAGSIAALCRRLLAAAPDLLSGDWPVDPSQGA